MDGGTGRSEGAAGAVAGQEAPRVERLSGPGTETSKLRGGAATEGPDTALPVAPAELISPIFTALIPGPPADPGGAPAGPSKPGPAGPASPPDESPLPGPASGSSAAGATVSFTLGGLALLLATLSLAGPALRRRLPRRPVIGWPAAFVPLLERPG
jgi:hypothetical protein